MKLSIAALAASLALLAVDARVAASLMQAQAPGDIAKWLTMGFTMVSAVVTIAISFTVVRVTLTSHKTATEAALAERVHVTAFEALQRQVDRQHGEIRDDISELRKDVMSAIKQPRAS